VEGGKVKIFISHSSYDRWVARKISEDLQRCGIETFLDEKDIETGESIDTSIGGHLKDCSELLILLSPASLKSHWIFIELGGAQILGKKIVPILFHVGANEIPSPINKYLARDINEIEKYYTEAKKRSKQKVAKKATIPKAKKKVVASGKRKLKKGDTVEIVNSRVLMDSEKARPPKWVPQMDKYSEQKATVTQVLKNKNLVKLDVDHEEFTWHQDWLMRI
jgi:hypothetical protein